MTVQMVAARPLAGLPAGVAGEEAPRAAHEPAHADQLADLPVRHLMHDPHAVHLPNAAGEPAALPATPAHGAAAESYGVLYARLTGSLPFASDGLNLPPMQVYSAAMAGKLYAMIARVQSDIVNDDV